jgi:hypothetical protein
MATLTLGQTESALTITQTSLADGAGRQSTALDLGASRAPLVKVRVKFKPTSSPTAGRAVLYFSAWSEDNSSNSYNDALSGSDAAFSDRDELAQLVPIGDVRCDNDTGSHQATFVIPTQARYLVVVAWNDLGVAFSSTAGDHAVAVSPIIHTSS